MRVAILGDGLLGRTLADECDARGIERSLVSHRQFDIRVVDDVKAMLGFIDADVAINTVAFHRLGECEANPDRAYAVNAYGAGTVASLIPTIYISTDYVHSSDGPHDEGYSGRRPRSVYGRSKLAGEFLTQEHGGIVVRVSGLYGRYPSHKGPAFPETILSSHDPIRLPCDQRFSPTFADDAAKLILDLVETRDGLSGIYHTANSGSTTWAEFGQHIADASRHRRHISAYKAHDPLRPTDSSLVSTRLPALPAWQDALDRWTRWHDEENLRALAPAREGA